MRITLLFIREKSKSAIFKKNTLYSLFFLQFFTLLV